jgi:hypothetical protein
MAYTTDTVTVWVMPHDDEEWVINDEQDMQQNFDDFVNETEDEISILGLQFEPARVLREADPVAYRENFLAYCQGWEEMEMPWDLWYHGTKDVQNEWVSARVDAYSNNW